MSSEKSSDPIEPEKGGALGIPLRVTVSVPTYMREKFIVASVNSILSNTYEDFELIVVDQSPSRSIESLLHMEFGPDPRLRYIHIDRVGQSHARNVALREAQGELILYADDDVRVTENWVQAYVDCYSYLRGRGIMPGVMGGPAQGLWEAPKPDWWPAEFLYCLNEFDLPGGRQEYSKGHLPSTTNFAVPTSLLRAVGGFDERVGCCSSKRTLSTVGGEDTRVVLQLERLRYKPYFEPSALVYHVMVKERLTRGFFFRRLFGVGVDTVAIRLEFEPHPPLAIARLVAMSCLRLARSLLRLTVGQAAGAGRLTAKERMREWGHSLISLGELFGIWIWFSKLRN